LNAYSIVFVCTGNRFRSPLAEAFVRRLTLGLPVVTQSFGTLELGDTPPLPEAVEIALSCGIALSSHRTRHLGLESLEEIDLLVGFEESHVRQAVVEANAPRDRSFTLRELVRLGEHVGPFPHVDVAARARAAIAQAAEVRGAEPAPRGREDVPDPFGGPWNVYRESAVEIRELSIHLVATLFGVSETRGLPPVLLERRRSRSFFRRR
jgi:protein-tyrosine phosphatase